MKNEAFVVPLKPFDLAKERLRGIKGLDVTALAHELALGVIASCAPKTVIVVSDDDAVTSFAAALGVEVWRSPSAGLNAAVTSAYVGLRDEYERLIVVHGDLRHPDGLGMTTFDPGVTIFADHLGLGTNVLALPTGLDFQFGYGASSLAHHVNEARRLGVAHRVVLDSPWRFDVDEPTDLTGA